MDKPITTLFMLMSVDGKISTGASDALDFDRDLPQIPGVCEGLQQYYEIEQTTDLWSLNSGRVQAKIGVNEAPIPPKTEVSFVLIDNHHLTEHGVRYFCARAKEFVLVTCNPEHPAYRVQEENLHIIQQDELNLAAILRRLKAEFSCERVTIQSGGTLNALFLREGLFDYIDIVVAPLIVGGKDTPTIVDGQAIASPEELMQLAALKLERVEQLENSYLRIRYKVMK